MDLETLVATGQHVVFILGNLETSEFEIVTLEDLPLAESRTKNNNARGLAFLGSTGFVNGVPSSVLETNLDASHIQALAAAYVQHVASRIFPRLTATSVVTRATA